MKIPRASLFGTFRGSGVTNTGSSVINNGNVGSSPKSTVTGFPPGVVNNGTLFTAANAVTSQAHADPGTAYTAAQTAPGGTPGPADLGGATLNPGVYTYATTASWTAGNPTLNDQGNPNAQWIFQIGTGLTTPAGAMVVLSNDASADNVFWQIGSSATLGAATPSPETFSRIRASLSAAAPWTNGLVSISAAETVNVPGVPEPSTLLVVGIGLALLTTRRRPTA